jgi:hypothetical protein
VRIVETVAAVSRSFLPTPNFREIVKSEVELRRNPIPRTRVNKGKKKGRGYHVPTLY